MSILIREATESDKPVLHQNFMNVVKAGEAFMHDESTSYEEWELFWFGKGVTTYSAVEEGTIIGSYILKPNHPGVGSHIVNGGYMVAANQQGKGIGALLGNHSLSEAKRLGFTAIQFNAVVATNASAVKLWEKLGFKIVGTNPKAFRHKIQGLVDTYTMYREL